jgi:hypothetical protein
MKWHWQTHWKWKNKPTRSAPDIVENNVNWEAEQEDAPTDS